MLSIFYVLLLRTLHSHQSSQNTPCDGTHNGNPLAHFTRETSAETEAKGAPPKIRYNIPHQVALPPTKTPKTPRPVGFGPPERRFIFVKTHKTASTTLGSILFRFGAKNRVKFAQINGHYRAPCAQNVSVALLPDGTYPELTLYHHTVELRKDALATAIDYFNITNDKNKTTGYCDIHKWYPKVIPNGNWVTVLRDPIQRYISHYYYFIEPSMPDINKFLKTNWARNKMCFDLGIITDSHLEEFFEHHFDDYFWILQERLLETLILFKNRFRWKLEDLVHLHLLKTCGNKRWDGVVLKCPPKMDSWEPDVLEKMQQNNHLDMALYERVEERVTGMLEQQSPDFWEEVEKLRRMQEKLASLCNPEIVQQPALLSQSCAAYNMTDLTYEPLLNRDGSIKQRYTPPTEEFLDLLRRA